MYILNSWNKFYKIKPVIGRSITVDREYWVIVFLGLASDSTCVLEVEPGKLDISSKGPSIAPLTS